MAGTGKLTISLTIAEWLAGQRQFGAVDLGASFSSNEVKVTEVPLHDSFPPSSANEC